MRIHHLLLLSFLTGATALKGEPALRSRAFVRGLEGDGEGDDTDLPTKDAKDGEAGKTGGPPLKGVEKGDVEETMLPENEGKGGKDGKGAKEGKEGKDAKKGEKKAKKDCKSAKAAKAKPDDAVLFRTGEEALPYCLQSQLSLEECSKLKAGDLPEDHPKVEGDINMEIVYEGNNSPDRVLREVETILRKKTSLKYVGCATHRRLAEEDEADDMDEAADMETKEENLSVTGVDFMRLMVSEEGCSPGVVEDEDSNIKCDKIETDVDVFYTGKDSVSKKEKKEMFALLVETIRTQAAEGAFDKAGKVESVGSDSAGSDDDGVNIGIPLGAAFGGVALLAIGGGAYYKRKTATAARLRKSPSETSDSSGEGHGTRTGRR